MSILANFDGFDFPIRESDGYWNLTAMCQKYEKRVNDFLRLDSTKDFLKTFDDEGFADAGFPVTGLARIGKPIEIIKGGNDRSLQGTWGHPQVALKLSAWLNPYFERWVYATIEKLFKEGKVELENEIDSLRSALDITKAQIDRMWNDSLLNDLESRYPEYLESIDD